ncbi:MAG: hypothetical protein ACYCTZ_04800 [Candidatus Dormibacteria bacterium]
MPAGYVPSKWINSKGVFVAPPDSGASASLKAQWEQAFGVLPPPAGFVKGLGRVVVNNQTSLSQSQANALGEEFLVDQGYLTYFLEEGSLNGALAVSAGNAITAFPTVQNVLGAGGRVQTIGCQLPMSMVLVDIPSPPGPTSGASAYGLVELSDNTAPGRSCSMVTISKTGQRTTLFHVAGINESAGGVLQEGAKVALASMGVTVWKNLGSWNCPTYTVGQKLTIACPTLLPAGSG